jgi:hypothetical protein
MPTLLVENARAVAGYVAALAIAAATIGVAILILKIDVVALLFR